MSTVGYPSIMSKKSHSKYPQAMPKRTYDAHHPQKSLFIKDQREEFCRSDGCVHSWKYAVAKDQHKKVTSDEYKKKPNMCYCREKTLARHDHCQCTRTSIK